MLTSLGMVGLIGNTYCVRDEDGQGYGDYDGVLVHGLDDTKLVASPLRGQPDFASLHALNAEAVIQTSASEALRTETFKNSDVHKEDGTATASSVVETQTRVSEWHKYRTPGAQITPITAVVKKTVVVRKD